MGPVVGDDTYWYRQEFAKSKGMVQWHGLCWRSDKQPYDLLHEAIVNGLSDEHCAEKLSTWAAQNFGLTAFHPAGKDELGNPNRNLWPPPEGSASLLQKKITLCINFPCMPVLLKKVFWKIIYYYVIVSICIAVLTNVYVPQNQIQ